MDGLRAFFRLVWDSAAGRRFEQDAQTSLDKGTDPRTAKRNLTTLEAGMDRLKGAAVKLGSALAAAFAIEKVRAFLAGTVRDFAEAESHWTRLSGTLRTVGVDFRAVRGEIEDAAKAMQRATTIGDEDFADILGILVQQSRDFEGSMKNVQVVVDLAAAKQMDFASAGEVVGKALAGNTMLLERMFPALKGSTDAVGDLRTMVGGLAENEATDLGGRLTQLREATGDLNEEIGGIVIGGDNAADSVKNLTDYVRALTDWIDQHKGEISVFREDIVTIANAAKGPIKVSLEVTAAWAAGTAQFFRDLLSSSSVNDVVNDRLHGRLRGPLDQRLTRAALTEDAIRAGELPDSEAAARDSAALAAAAARAAEERRRIAAAALAEATADAKREMEARIKAMNDAAEEWARNRPVGTLSAGPQTRVGSLVQGTSRRQVSGVEVLGPLLGEELPDAAVRFQSQLESVLDNVPNIAGTAADGMAGAFANAFRQMQQDGASLGAFMEGLGRGMAASVLQGLSQIAEAKAAEAFAHSIEAGAKALLYKDPGAAASIPGFLAEAAAWSALAGFAGAGASAVMRGGQHGGGGYGGARDVGRGTAQGARGGGTEVHVYIDPLDPQRPAYQRNVYAAQQYATERFGQGTRVTVHPAQGDR